MYSEKEVAALIKAYNKSDKSMTPESFVKSADKEIEWDKNDKRAAIFQGDEDIESGFMVKMEMMFNVPCETIGAFASDEEIREEFKKMNPWIVDSIDFDEQIVIFKEGDLSNRGFVGAENSEEKSPTIREHVTEGVVEEVDRYEVLIKKIRYDDDKWSVLTYEVDGGHLSTGIDIPNCLDAILSSLAAVIRSSGDLQGQYMEKAIKGLNMLYLDASIEQQTYKTKKE